MWEEQQLSLLCPFLLLVHIPCDCLCEGHDDLWRKKAAFCPPVLLEPPSSIITQSGPQQSPSGLRGVNGRVHKAGNLTRREVPIRHVQYL